MLLGCCNVVARVPGMVARVVVGVPRVAASVSIRLLGRLLGYLGWLLKCCCPVVKVVWAVARVPGVVAKVLLSGC